MVAPSLAVGWQFALSYHRRSGAGLLNSFPHLVGSQGVCGNVSPWACKFCDKIPAKQKNFATA
jgi:hypothetical protein